MWKELQEINEYGLTATTLIAKFLRLEAEPETQFNDNMR